MMNAIICVFLSPYSDRKGEELSASAIAKREEESKLAREKMREEQRRRREAVSEPRNTLDTLL